MRVYARDIKSGDVIDGARVAYNTTMAGNRSHRIIKFDDGRSWLLFHGEKQEVERQES